MIKTVMSEVTRLYDQPQVLMISRSYKRVTSEMTVLIIGTWGRSYKRVTSDMPMIKTVISEVTRLYDQPQVLMIKTVMSEDINV
jgi:hypothetical protein